MKSREGIFSGIGVIAEMAELAEIAKSLHCISNNPGALYISGRKIIRLGIMYFADSWTGLKD